MTMQERKPLFLAPDFDRWLDESDAELELREKVTEKKRSVCVSVSERYGERGRNSMIVCF